MQAICFFSLSDIASDEAVVNGAASTIVFHPSYILVCFTMSAHNVPSSQPHKTMFHRKKIKTNKNNQNLQNSKFDSVWNQLCRFLKKEKKVILTQNINSIFFLGQWEKIRILSIRQKYKEAMSIIFSNCPFSVLLYAPLNIFKSPTLSPYSFPLP